LDSLFLDDHGAQATRIDSCIHRDNSYTYAQRGAKEQVMYRDNTQGLTVA